MLFRVEWDEAKDIVNRKKHDVSFELASNVFEDIRHVSRKDRDVDGEERWHAIGLVNGSMLLLVVHVLYEEDDAEVIRIISARKALRKERRIYEDENR